MADQGPAPLWTREELTDMVLEGTTPDADGLVEWVAQAPAPGEDRVAAYRTLLTRLGVAEDTITVMDVPVPDDDWFRTWRSQWTSALREAGMGPLDAEAVLGEEEARLRANPGRSVVVRHAGESGRTILVGTALDAPRGASGVVDNWSSCVVLAHLCVALQARSTRHTVVLVAFAAEEQGSLGARAFLDAMPEEQSAQTDAMINLECLGMGSPALWSQGSTGSLKLLAGLTARLGGIPLEMRDYADVNVARGDAAPFRRAGIPTLAMDGLHLENARFLGTSEETAALVGGPYLQEAWRLVHGLLTLLDPHEGRLTMSVLQERLPLEDGDELLPVPVLLMGPGGPVRVELTGADKDD